MVSLLVTRKLLDDCYFISGGCLEAARVSQVVAMMLITGCCSVSDGFKVVVWQFLWCFPGGC